MTLDLDDEVVARTVALAVASALKDGIQADYTLRRDLVAALVRGSVLEGPALAAIVSALQAEIARLAPEIAEELTRSLGTEIRTMVREGLREGVMRRLAGLNAASS